MSAPETNEALRSHVTRVGFDLTLGKTHVAALVWLNESIKAKDHIATNRVVGPMRRTFAFFVPGVHGLADRGLVIHHYNPAKEKRSRNPSNIGHHYTITPAGKLVIGLLREAGIYQEYADALPRVEAVAS